MVCLEVCGVVCLSIACFLASGCGPQSVWFPSDVVCWLSYTGVVSAVFHSRCVLAIVAEKRGCGRDISQKWVKIFESNENR